MRLDDSSADEDLPEVFLHEYLGTRDNPENIENPRELNLRVFPTEHFNNQMLRYTMLRKSKSVRS